MLFVKVSDYRNKKWTHKKSFQIETPTINETIQDLKAKARLYTLQSLHLLPTVILHKIDYNNPCSITYVYANKLHLISRNISNLSPEQILRLIKMRKGELISFWVYSLSVNNTETLYNITEVFTIYTGLGPSSRVRVKKKITNYISITHNKIDVLYFNKRDEITREIYNYFREHYKVSSKSEFLMKLFEVNGKLDEVKFFWKFKVGGERKETKIHEEVYIWFDSTFK